MGPLDQKIQQLLRVRGDYGGERMKYWYLKWGPLYLSWAGGWKFHTEKTWHRWGENALDENSLIGYPKMVSSETGLSCTLELENE